MRPKDAARRYADLGRLLYRRGLSRAQRQRLKDERWALVNTYGPEIRQVGSRVPATRGHVTLKKPTAGGLLLALADYPPTYAEALAVGGINTLGSFLAANVARLGQATKRAQEMGLSVEFADLITVQQDLQSRGLQPSGHVVVLLLDDMGEVVRRYDPRVGELTPDRVANALEALAEKVRRGR